MAMDRGGMTGTTGYAPGWTLDDIHWEGFDPAKVERGLLAAVKSAALVELNAPDYVTYLQRVFRDSDANTLANIEQWGREEIQHGLALGRWAERADPSFDFKFALFAKRRRRYSVRVAQSNHHLRDVTGWPTGGAGYSRYQSGS